MKTITIEGKEIKVFENHINLANGEAWEKENYDMLIGLKNCGVCKHYQNFLKGECCCENEENFEESEIIYDDTILNNE